MLKLVVMGSGDYVDFQGFWGDDQIFTVMVKGFGVLRRYEATFKKYGEPESGGFFDWKFVFRGERVCRLFNSLVPRGSRLFEFVLYVLAVAVARSGLEGELADCDGAVFETVFKVATAMALGEGERLGDEMRELYDTLMLKHGVRFAYIGVYDVVRVGSDD